MMRFSQSKRFLSRGEEKDLKKSIQNYQQLLQQEPRNPEYWNSLGDLYLRIRDRDNALKCYENAFRLYAEEGYTENAIGVGKKILRHDPSRAAIHLELARLYADPDVKNYKAALDEIQRFYQTAQRLDREQLNLVMDLLSRMWGDLSSLEDVENLPIAENLFAQTEELIANIAMSGMKETENPLRQEDLASLEKIYGGEEGPEGISAGEILEAEAPAEEPVMTVIEEEPAKDVAIPRIEEEPARDVAIPRIEEESSAPEVPVLPEEPETSPPPRPTIDGEAEALFSVLEGSEGSMEVAPREARVGKVSAQRIIDEEMPVEIREERSPSPSVAAGEEGENHLDVQEFVGFLAEQIPLLGGEVPGADYLDAGYALLGQGRAEEALQAFVAALQAGASPFAALLGVARASAAREDWEGVVEAVSLMERLEPGSGGDWKALGAAYALRAQAHQRLGDADGAFRDARRARILGG